MFDGRYEVILADNAAGRCLHYRIRYLVYCMETGFEDRRQFPDGQEHDVWDDRAVHFMVRTRASGEWIAAMRLILPQQGQLPIKQLCQIDTLPAASPSQSGEISRLCIIDRARRRMHRDGPLPGLAGSGTSPLAEHREHEIMLGLLRAAAAYSRSHDIHYWYFMTTTALARMVKRLNILLNPIGPMIQHRGERYPFLADLDESEHQVRSKSAEIATMLAQQTAYHLFSVVCSDMMPLPCLPEPLPLVAAQARAAA